MRLLFETLSTVQIRNYTVKRPMNILAMVTFWEPGSLSVLPSAGTKKVHNNDEIKNVTLLVTKSNNPERNLNFNMILILSSKTEEASKPRYCQK